MRKYFFGLMVLLAAGISNAAQQCAVESGEAYSSQPEGEENPQLSSAKIVKGNRYEVGLARDGWSSVDVDGATHWARAWLFAFSCKPDAAWIPPKQSSRTNVGGALNVTRTKKAVADLFKDPDSVRFRDLGVYQKYNSEQRYLCGEVNAKNSYGAFVGNKTFYAADGDVQVITDEENRLDWINYREYCHKRISAVK